MIAVSQKARHYYRPACRCYRYPESALELALVPARARASDRGSGPESVQVHEPAIRRGSRRCTAGLNHHAQLSGLHRVSPGCLAPSAVIGTVSAGSIGDQCICGIGNIHKRIRFSIPILQFPRRRHSQAPSIGGELHTAGIDGDFAIPFVVELHFTGIRPRTPNAGVINRAIARNGFAVVKRGNTSCPRRRFLSTSVATASCSI